MKDHGLEAAFKATVEVSCIGNEGWDDLKISVLDVVDECPDIFTSDPYVSIFKRISVLQCISVAA